MTERPIRPFRTLEEYQACLRLQEEVWGVGFSELVPVAILKVAQRLGGLASGAWGEGGRLDGFVFGMTGVEDGRAVHWSDMLAVRPGLQDAGLGFRLKLHQRDHCLERGIGLVYWTFDPLESRNARLNLGKLGALAGEYVVDMYGASTSPLHRGIGTDRFVVHWLVASERVARRLSGAEAPPGEEAAAGLPESVRWIVRDGLPVPESWEETPPGERFLVPIPADLQAVKARDPGLAAAWRRATRAALEPAIGAGWEARELIRGEPVSRYLVARRDP